MNISIEELKRLIFDENKTQGEISIIYNISPNKLKKIMKEYGISLTRTKACNQCGIKNQGSPPEGAGGMSFELTKD